MAAHTAAEALPVLVTLPAEVDIANARDVGCQLTAAALKPGVRMVIADMSTTTFCDCAGVRALLLAHKRAAGNGAELHLLRPGCAVMRILELTGADQLLVVAERLEAITPSWSAPPDPVDPPRARDIDVAPKPQATRQEAVGSLHSGRLYP